MVLVAKLLKDYPGISLRVEDINRPLDVSAVFGRSAPLHIEIGSGKGTFLLAQAQGQPDVNFLGIEWAGKYYRVAVDRMGRWGISNVRLIHTDASDFIIEFAGDSSVQCYNIYYPDPWPKKRHHKRRFVNKANVELMLRSLAPGGIIRIATDHTEYFEWMKEVLAEKQNQIEHVDFTPTAGAEEGEVIGTNYERKYIKEKRDIHTIAVQKRSVV